MHLTEKLDLDAFVSLYFCEDNNCRIYFVGNNFLCLLFFDSYSVFFAKQSLLHCSSDGQKWIKCFLSLLLLFMTIMMFSLSIIKGDIYFDHFLCIWHTLIDQRISLLLQYPIQAFWMTSRITEHIQLNIHTASTDLSTTFTEPVLEL